MINRRQLCKNKTLLRVRGFLNLLYFEEMDIVLIKPTLITLDPDLLLSICSYLDDDSYVHLWITCTKFHRLLKSLIFLRSLFHKHDINGLTLPDLQRGFRNIAIAPTVTYCGEEKLYNRYRWGYEKFLLDIFGRVYVLQGGEIHYIHLTTRDGHITPFRKGYVMYEHDNTLVIVNQDLNVIDVIFGVQKYFIYQGRSNYTAGCDTDDVLIFRRSEGPYHLYRQPNKTLVVFPVVPIEEIKIMYITVPTGMIERYEINLILDVNKRLVKNNRIIAEHVEEIQIVDRNNFSYLTDDGTLHMYCHGQTTIIGTNIMTYHLISSRVIAYINEEEQLYWCENDDARHMAGPALFLHLYSNRIMWYDLNSDAIRGGRVKRKYNLDDLDRYLAEFSLAYEGTTEYLIAQYGPVLDDYFFRQQQARDKK